MSKRILLADDSVTIQKVIELTFMDQNIAVDAVSSGDEAMKRLETSAPDLVIADVHMPGALGYDVARRSKQVLPHVPVLLLVGTFETFDEAQYATCGADQVLRKPFDSQELLRIVDELMPAAPAASAAAAEPAPPAATSFSIGPLDSPDFDDTPAAASPFGAPAFGSPAYGAPAFEAPSFAAPVAEPTSFEAPSTELWQEEPFRWEEAPAAPAAPSFEAAPAFEAEPVADPWDLASPAVAPSFAEPEPFHWQGPAAEEPGGLSWESSGLGSEEVAEVVEVVEVSDDFSAELGPADEFELEVFDTGLPAARAQAETRVQEEPRAAAAEPAALDASASAVAAPAGQTSALSDDDVERIAVRVAELIGERLVKNVAWDVVPDLAEVIIKNRLRELEAQAE